MSGSASQARVTGDPASVGEQSGIVAGRGGYDVAAGGKVDLTGGVISSAKAFDADASHLAIAQAPHGLDPLPMSRAHQERFFHGRG